MSNRTESPFLKSEPVRISFSTILVMLLTVVGAGVGLLLYFAFKVPAITSELNAWMGRPVAAADSADARRAQLVFALFTYTAPLALGILVYGLHFVLNFLDRATRDRRSSADDEFRME